jgi:hypothetical protein
MQVVSPERELILSVQLETMWMNGASTHNLVENLVQMVLKLSEDFQQLRRDNEYLRYHLNKRYYQCTYSIGTCCETISQGVSTLPDDVPPPSTAASADSSASAGAGADTGSKSYKDVLSTGLKPKVSDADCDGFTTMSYKTKPTSGTPSVNTVRQRRQPLRGVINSASLPIIV